MTPEFWIQLATLLLGGAGALVRRFSIGAGLYADGLSDMGAGTVNTTGLYVNGVVPPTSPWTTGTTVTIADDGVFSFTPTRSAGEIIFSTGSGTALVFQGKAIYVAAVGGGMIAGTSGANFTVTTSTGTLTGTTGIDGNITIRANTDGKIYVENRSGTGRDLTYYITR